MWPATPTNIVHYAPYLLVYSENAIDVFDYSSIEWLQTIPLKRVRPLSSNGLINVAYSMEPAKLVFMQNKRAGKPELVIPELTFLGQRQLIRKNKRLQVFKIPPEEHKTTIRSELLRNPEKRSQLISAPQNFNHIAHMGPGDGLPIVLKDIPTINQHQTADSHPSNDLISNPSNFNHVCHLGAESDALSSALSIDDEHRAQQEDTQSQTTVGSGSFDFNQTSVSKSSLYQHGNGRPQHSVDHSESISNDGSRHHHHASSRNHHSNYTRADFDSDSRISTGSGKSSDESYPPSPGLYTKYDDDIDNWEI